MMLPNIYDSSELISIYQDLEIPIIVISSIDEEDGLYFAKKINALAFFKKPIDHEKFLIKVNSVLKNSLVN